MSTPFKPFCRALVVLWMLTAVPVMAQLNPKWQTFGTPDFLDLYQQSTSLKVKPEIATVLDFSGSMHRGMFHPLFPNDWADEDRDSTTSSYRSVWIQIKSSGGSYVVDYIKFGGNTMPGSAATLTVNGGTTLLITGTQLIKPNGQVLTAADVNNHPYDPELPGSNANPRASNAMNWVRCASHARMVLTQINGATVTSRTIDFPLTWAILPNRGWSGTSWDPGLADPANDNTNPSPGNAFPFDPSAEPLPRLRVKNSADSTWYDLDSTYRGITSGNVQLQRGGSDLQASVGNRGTNVALYRTRYIHWVFAGKDASNNYIVPDAVTAGSYYYPDPAKHAFADPTQPALTHTLRSGSTGAAFANGLPNRTRLQAVKEAIIRTWVRYQNDVFWAFRALSYGSGATVDTATNAGSPTPTIPVPTLDQNNNQFANNGTWTTRWYLWNGNSGNGIQFLSKVVPNGGTPLTRSHASVYAQLQNENPFAYVQTGDDKPVECMNHFMLLFTDGAPNEDNMPVETSLDSFPYLSGPVNGNSKVKTATYGSLDPGGSYWNSPTLSGVAAHGFSPKLGLISDPATYNPSGSGDVSDFAPFWIKRRGTGSNALNYASPHPIQTMTVGVSLGSTYENVTAWPIPVTKGPKAINTDITGSKFRLMATAAFGDPDKTDYNFTSVKPFYQDPSSSSPKAAPDACFFFDAYDPNSLLGNLEAAISIATQKGGKYATAAPQFPIIGVGLGKQLYLAKFQAPEKGGPVWGGDLKMFPTKEVNGQTIIVDANGSPILGDVDTANASWSATASLQSQGWTNRTVYTRLPASPSSWNPSLVRIKDSGAEFDTIKNWIRGLTSTSPYYNSTMRTLSDADLQKHLRWVMGADIASSASPLPTRSKDVMGDIINSTPAILEYTLNSTMIARLPGDLAVAAGRTGAKFRVLFVGTNQGHLHAFGEVSWPQEVKIGEQTVTVAYGVVRELWAFVPTDVLPYLDYFQAGANRHRFAVDGSPTVFHQDLVASGTRKANGTVDDNEYAAVVFGLGKGGRSYYCIQVQDPLTPQMGGNSVVKGWALVPDEADSYPDARFESPVDKSVIRNMGYSTCAPSHGLMIHKSSDTWRRILFLGGGYSVPEIELNYPTTGAKTPMGRSALALDLVSGKIMRTWNMSADATVGPVAAGVVPFEFVLGSRLTQRAYFGDLWGGVWALGSTSTVASGDYQGFRVDSHKIEEWSDRPRPIYRGTLPNDRLSTLVAPYLVGEFFPLREITGAGGSKYRVTPSTVGIAFTTGDRNNPMDDGYSATSLLLTKPTQHRTMVVFDRQDSALIPNLDNLGIQPNQIFNVPTVSSSSDIANLWQTVYRVSNTDGTLNDSFFLKSNYGYAFNYPMTSGDGGIYRPKGMTPPMVLSGVLFYSYFEPATFDRCTGGSGQTKTNRICDVRFPVWSGNVAVNSSTPSILGCRSGEAMTWTGVASRLTAKGPLAALQAGAKPSGSGGGGSSAPGSLQTETITGRMGARFAQPRTWRTVR